ncbi:MAG TPA: outer membrane lipoprotein carrier protein LolA, partial [Flavitalea sp.]|nr:outer membrane lipoprotein carrier protein LolA [Flavitalea sp.]
QEKNLSMLSEKIKSKGKFWFKKENRIRMEYLSPFQYIMVINKDRVTIRDGQKTNSMSVSSNRLFQQVNKIIIDCVQGSALNNTDFKTRVFGNSNNYLIEMKPISKSLKNLFESIVITLDKKDNSVSSINMIEKSGDNTFIRFTGKQMNTNIADEVFIIH